MYSVVAVLGCAICEGVGVMKGEVWKVADGRGKRGMAGIGMVLENVFQLSVAKRIYGPQYTKRQPGRMQPPFGSSAQVLRDVTVGVGVSVNVCS